MNFKEIFQQEVLSLKKPSTLTLIFSEIKPEKSPKPFQNEYGLKNKILKHIKSKKSNKIVQAKRINRFDSNAISRKMNLGQPKNGFCNQYVSYSKHNSSRKYSKDSIRSSSGAKSSTKRNSHKTLIKKLTSDNDLNISSKPIGSFSNQRFIIPHIFLEQDKSLIQIKSKHSLVTHIQNTIGLINSQKHDIYFRRMYEKYQVLSHESSNSSNVREYQPRSLPKND